MRCCSCGRKSLPESWRAFACMALPTSSSESPSSPKSRRPNSTSGTVSMSKTSVFIGAPSPGASPWPSLWLRLRLALRFGFAAASSTATATMSPASSVSVTWPSPIPNWRRTFSPRGEYATSGLPQAFCTTPTSRIQMPCAKPVPMALTMASLAAKRMAMNRSGRFVRPSCARSAGMSSRSMKWSPNLARTFLMRAASSTSTPMPKIIGAHPASAPSCRAPPLRGQ